jgi:hypothetical protein
VALWAIQKMKGIPDAMPGRVSATGGIYWLDDAKEVPDTQIVTYHYPDLLLSFELRSFGNDHMMHAGQKTTGSGPTDFGIAYYGTEASLLISNSGWKVYTRTGEPGPSEKSVPETHEKNFLECVKSRQKPNSDVETGRLSTTLCHLGNVSFKLGRDVKWDAKTETFPRDKEANKLLTKDYRTPFGLPKV